MKPLVSAVARIVLLLALCLGLTACAQRRVEMEFRTEPLVPVVLLDDLRAKSAGGLEAVYKIPIAHNRNQSEGKSGPKSNFEVDPYFDAILSAFSTQSSLEGHLRQLNNGVAQNISYIGNDAQDATVIRLAGCYVIEGFLEVFAELMQNQIDSVKNYISQSETHSSSLYIVPADEMDVLLAAMNDIKKAYATIQEKVSLQKEEYIQSLAMVKSSGSNLYKPILCPVRSFEEKCLDIEIRWQALMPERPEGYHLHHISKQRYALDALSLTKANIRANTRQAAESSQYTAETRILLNFWTKFLSLSSLEALLPGFDSIQRGTYIYWRFQGPEGDFRLKEKRLVHDAQALVAEAVYCLRFSLMAQ